MRGRLVHVHEHIHQLETNALRIAPLQFKLDAIRPAPPVFAVFLQVAIRLGGVGTRRRIARNTGGRSWLSSFPAGLRALQARDQTLDELTAIHPLHSFNSSDAVADSGA